MHCEMMYKSYSRPRETLAHAQHYTRPHEHIADTRACTTVIAEVVSLASAARGQHWT